MAHTRTIHIPPPAIQAAPAPEPSNDRLLVYGQLIADHRTLGRLLQQLPLEAEGIHGNTQAIASTLRRMESRAAFLIAEVSRG